MLGSVASILDRQVGAHSGRGGKPPPLPVPGSWKAKAHGHNGEVRWVIEDLPSRACLALGDPLLLAKVGQS